MFLAPRFAPWRLPSAKKGFALEPWRCRSPRGRWRLKLRSRSDMRRDLHRRQRLSRGRYAGAGHFNHRRGDCSFALRLAPGRGDPGHVPAPFSVRARPMTTENDTTATQAFDPLKRRCVYHPRRQPRWIVQPINPKTGKQRPPICRYCAEERARLMRKARLSRLWDCEPEEVDT